jgi:hypothetical protein
VAPRTGGDVFLEKINCLPVVNCTTVSQTSSLVNVPNDIPTPILGGRRDLTVREGCQR